MFILTQSTTRYINPLLLKYRIRLTPSERGKRKVDINVSSKKNIEFEVPI